MSEKKPPNLRVLCQPSTSVSVAPNFKSIKLKIAADYLKYLLSLKIFMQTFE